MATLQFSFGDYTFPVEDSPSRGGAGEWTLDEKLIEQDPLMASVTILTSWGFRSRRRTISGLCGEVTRDDLKLKHTNKLVGAFVDGEAVSVTCRIIKSDFITLSTSETPRFSYVVTFMER